MSGQSFTRWPHDYGRHSSYFADDGAEFHIHQSKETDLRLLDGTKRQRLAVEIKAASTEATVPFVQFFDGEPLVSRQPRSNWWRADQLPVMSGEGISL